MTTFTSSLSQINRATAQVNVLTNSCSELYTSFLAPTRERDVCFLERDVSLLALELSCIPFASLNERIYSYIGLKPPREVLFCKVGLSLLRESFFSFTQKLAAKSQINGKFDDNLQRIVSCLVRIGLVSRGVLELNWVRDIVCSPQRAWLDRMADKVCSDLDSGVTSCDHSLGSDRDISLAKVVQLDFLILVQNRYENGKVWRAIELQFEELSKKENGQRQKELEELPKKIASVRTLIRDRYDALWTIRCPQPRVLFET